MKTLKNSATGASTQLVSRVGSGLRGTPAVNNHSSRYQCSTLQHTATRCNTLQHAATYCYKLQRTASRCNQLQPIATNCNQLQPIAINFNTPLAHVRACALVHVYTRALAHTQKSWVQFATHYNALPHTTTRCINPCTRAHTRNLERSLLQTVQIVCVGNDLVGYLLCEIIFLQKKPLFGRALVHQRIRYVRAPTDSCRPCILIFLWTIDLQKQEFLEENSQYRGLQSLQPHSRLTHIWDHLTPPFFSSSEGPGCRV